LRNGSDKTLGIHRLSDKDDMLGPSSPFLKVTMLVYDLARFFDKDAHISLSQMHMSKPKRKGLPGSIKSNA
jgi:hypothetical protein